VFGGMAEEMNPEKMDALAESIVQLESTLNTLSSSVSSLTTATQKANTENTKFQKGLGSVTKFTNSAFKAMSSFAEGILFTNIAQNKLLNTAAEYNMSLYEGVRAGQLYGNTFKEMSSVFKDVEDATGLSERAAADLFSTYSKGLKNSVPDTAAFSKLVKTLGDEFGFSKEKIEDAVSTISQLKDLKVGIDEVFIERANKGLVSTAEMMAKINNIKLAGGSDELIEKLYRLNKPAKEGQKELKTMADMVAEFTSQIDEFVASNGTALKELFQELIKGAQFLMDIAKGIDANTIKWVTTIGLGVVGFTKVAGVASSFLTTWKTIAATKAFGKANDGLDSVLNNLNNISGASKKAKQSMGKGFGALSKKLVSNTKNLAKMPVTVKGVGTAALVAGAAFAGWKIGSLIAETETYKNVVNKIGDAYADWAVPDVELTDEQEKALALFKANKSKRKEAYELAKKQKAALAGQTEEIKVIQVGLGGLQKDNETILNLLQKQLDARKAQNEIVLGAGDSDVNIKALQEEIETMDLMIIQAKKYEDNMRRVYTMIQKGSTKEELGLETKVVENDIKRVKLLMKDALEAEDADPRKMQLLKQELADYEKLLGAIESNDLTESSAQFLEAEKNRATLQKQVIEERIALSEKAYKTERDLAASASAVGDAYISAQKSFMGGLGLSIEAIEAQVGNIRREADIVNSEMENVGAQIQSQRALLKQAPDRDRAGIQKTINGLIQKQNKLKTDGLSLLQKENEYTKEIRVGYLSAIQSQASSMGRFDKLLLKRDQGISTIMKNRKVQSDIMYGGVGDTTQARNRIKTHGRTQYTAEGGVRGVESQKAARNEAFARQDKTGRFAIQKDQQEKAKSLQASNNAEAVELGTAVSTGNKINADLTRQQSKFLGSKLDDVRKAIEDSNDGNSVTQKGAKGSQSPPDSNTGVSRKKQDAEKKLQGKKQDAEKKKLQRKKQDVEKFTYKDVTPSDLASPYVPKENNKRKKKYTQTVFEDYSDLEKKRAEASSMLNSTNTSQKDRKKYNKILMDANKVASKLKNQMIIETEGGRGYSQRMSEGKTSKEIRGKYLKEDLYGNSNRNKLSEARDKKAMEDAKRNIYSKENAGKSVKNLQRKQLMEDIGKRDAQRKKERDHLLANPTEQTYFDPKSITNSLEKVKGIERREGNNKGVQVTNHITITGTGDADDIAQKTKNAVEQGVVKGLSNSANRRNKAP
jgi:hypothetical protein